MYSETLKNTRQESLSGNDSGGFITTFERSSPGPFLMGKYVTILPGTVYGRLSTIREVERIPQPNGIKVRAFLCKCECGNEKVVRLLHLRHNRVRSCGCLVGELHGLNNTQLYTVWRGMKNRCYCDSYVEKKYYQDKDIKICDEWRKSFKAFYDWSMSNGYKKGLTIDRREADKNYDPNNCRWVTPFENMLNAGNSKKIIYHNKEYYLAEMWLNPYFRKHMGAIRSRIKRGWNINDAFDIPIRKGNYKRKL